MASKPKGDGRLVEKDGLSRWYRFWWRFQYILFHIYGPAQMSEQLDPRQQLLRQRAAKVAAARAAKAAHTSA